VFQKIDASGSLEHFGSWLNLRYNKREEIATDEPEVNDGGLDVMAGYVIGALSNFVDVWVKIAYQDLPLVSLHDFGIIKTVEYGGNPTKKMIADQSLMERSTCMEAIKRMVKEGLFEEEPDSEDRRRKRVRLTPYGKEVNQEVTLRMTKLGTLLVGDLDDTEKKSVIPPLQKLLNFHKKLYFEEDREAVKDILGL
jgi:DNA-binding MarR family transcriptional regulator